MSATLPLNARLTVQTQYRHPDEKGNYITTFWRPTGQPYGLEQREVVTVTTEWKPVPISTEAPEK